MSTRKIKDAVDHGTKELIYFKGHAKATYMSDGSTVEDTINNIESKIDLSDYVTTDELEGYAKIEAIPSLEGYVKELDLPNFDEFAKSEDIPSVTGYATQLWVESQGYAHQEDLLEISFNDIQDSPISIDDSGMINFVDESGNVGFQINEEGLRVTDVIAGEHKLSEKANTSDIPSLDGYAKTEDIPSVNGFVKSEDLPNFDEFAKTEDIPSLDGYAKTEDIPSLDGYASKEWVNNRNYATEYDLKTIDYSTINNVPLSEDETGELNITDESGNIGMKVASEAVYAKDFVAGEHKLSEKQDKLVSGTNIRTINNQSILGSGDITIEAGSSLTESDIAAMGFTKNTGTYSKPSGGIHKADLTSDVQTSLGKADTALQSIPEEYATKTDVIPIFTQQISQGIGSINGNKLWVIPGSPDDPPSFNFKTINGESILGEGDITISGGGSSDANVQAVDTGDVVDDVNVDYATKIYVDGLIGDINSVLESIINGNQVNEVFVNIVESYLAAPVPKENIYDVICVLSKPLDVKQTATLYYLDGENQPQTLSLVVESGQTEFVFEQVMINHIEPDMYSVVIGEIEDEDANGIKVTLRSNFKFKYVYS